MDKEKVIKTFEDRIRDCSMIGDGFDVTINWKLADDILAMLKEQERIIKQYQKADGFLFAHGWKWEGR